MEYREICIVMVAHNQLKEVQISVKNLKMVLQNSFYKLVVVDNASEDGLGEWLKNQNELDYILCEDKIENYADILNTVISEFCADYDLLLLNPGLLLLPGCLEGLQEELYQNEMVGAVCPVIGARSWEEDLAAATEKATGYQEKNCRQVMNFYPESALIRLDFLQKMGDFDNELVLPVNVIMDYCLRARLESFRFVGVDYAWLYQIGNVEDIYAVEYGPDIDRKRLKEKWQMNYFNCKANERMLSLISNERGSSIDILEIGCDCGANLLYLGNRFPEARLYGAEINPMAAKIASMVGTITVADIEQKNLEFQSIKFDYIIFGDVLEHLRDPEGTLEYCKKLLKDDGRIITSIPNLMHFTVMMELLRGNFTYEDVGLLDRTHIHLFTYNEIIRMFERTGYKIEKIGYVTHPELPSPEQKVFVDKLMVFSKEVEEHMYYTYQYVVEAKKL